MDFNETLTEAVRRDSVRVPPYPSTAMRLQQVMARPDYTQAELVDAMRTDAVFTGNLLRLANSPFYRRGDAVTSLTVAVGRIGAKELTRLALAATVSSAAQGAGPLSQLRQQVWRQSLTSALVCEALAKVDGSDPGEAFVAGLLHDAGKLLVLSCLEEALGKRPLAEHAQTNWQQLLEAHHVAFGMLLSGKWQLPASLAHVISHHHDEVDDPMLKRVVISDRIVDALDEQASLDEATLASVTGLSSSACAALARTIPGVPVTIAAFEQQVTETHEAQQKARAAEPAEAPLKPPEVLDPVSLVFEVRSVGAPVVVDVRAAGARRFTALAPKPIALNRLVEFHVRGGELSVWAVVQRARKLGDAHELDCTLFAMSPETAQRWRELLGPARRAA